MENTAMNLRANDVSSKKCLLRSSQSISEQQLQTCENDVSQAVAQFQRTRSGLMSGLPGPLLIHGTPYTLFNIFIYLDDRLRTISSMAGHHPPQRFDSKVQWRLT